MSAQTTYAKIRVGQAFKFDHYGTVWVKAKGGFRHGLGGQLHACQPNVIVYRYNPADIAKGGAA